MRSDIESEIKGAGLAGPNMGTVAGAEFLRKWNALRKG